MDLGQESYLQLVQVGVLLIPGLLEPHEVRGTLVELHQQHLGDRALVRPSPSPLPAPSTGDAGRVQHDPVPLAKRPGEKGAQRRPWERTTHPDPRPRGATERDSPHTRPDITPCFSLILVMLVKSRCNALAVFQMPVEP